MLHSRIPQYRQLPELKLFEGLFDLVNDKSRIHTEATVEKDGLCYPIHTLCLGTQDKHAPTLAIFAGVHGLERVGTHVALASLQSLLNLATWDRSTQDLLKRVRILFMPIVNPIGMSLRWRANGSGVDIMRNAPIDADSDTKINSLVGGHRYGSWLPWYRGEVGQLEAETRAIIEFSRRELLVSERCISLDIHSGFGRKDRLWFPYAKSHKPIPNIDEIFALKATFDRSFPNHVYCIEPQSTQYTTHGDVWDFLFQERLNQRPTNISYLPLTLEMGSWMWVKKNPRQLFSSLGPFNPFIEHRFKRVLRRHLILIDFLLRALDSWPEWCPAGDVKKSTFSNEGKKLWWPEKA